MVRVRSTTRPPFGGRLTAALVAVAIGAAAGCTMCPDPFDYSGPVPNGSPPQNNFRARSRGILPLGGAPRPWPQVVHADGTDSEVETDAGEDAKVETVSVLRTVGTVAGDDEPLAAACEGAAVTEPQEPDPNLGPVFGPVAETVAEESPTEATAAPEAPIPAVEPPAVPAPAAETPGWRPRR